MPVLTVTADQVSTTSNAAVSPKDAMIVTTGSLNTGASSTQSITINSPAITPNSLIHASVGNGSNSAGTPVVSAVTPGTNPGTATVVIANVHTGNAFNGTLKLFIVIFN